MERNNTEAELKRLRDENADLQIELNVYKGISANSMFMRMLKGQMELEDDMRRECAENGVVFPSERFAVVIFSIQDSGDVFYEGGSAPPESEKTRSMVNLALENISTEMVNRKFYGKTVYGDGNMPCMVSFGREYDGADSSKAERDLKDVTVDIVGVLREKTGIEVCADVGRIHDGYRGLAESYAEADRVTEYRTLMELKTPVIHFDDISHENMVKPRNLYSMDQEQRLLTCIRRRDYRKAKEHMHELFKSYFTGYVPSIQFLQCRFWGFLSNMVSMIDEFDGAGDEEFMGRIDPIGRLLETKNISDLRRQTDYIFDCFIERMEAQKKSEPPKWFRPMLKYLEQNFSDPNINISTVSAQFGVHPSYAARIFRQYAGERMLDYIHRLRIENAKVLMQEKLPMSEIALRVGYSSGRAMVREFKKYEGTIPSSFKPE